MRTGRRTEQNTGFTLVELVVVLAVLAIAGALLAVGLTTVFNADAKKCAQSVSSALQTARQNNMSREGDSTYVAFAQDDSGRLFARLVVNGNEADRQAVSAKPVTVEAGAASTASGTPSGNLKGKVLYVSFRRGSGSLGTFAVLDGKIDDDLSSSVLLSRTGTGTGNGVIRIHAGRYTYAVTIDSVTGAVTTERM